MSKTSPLNIRNSKQSITPFSKANKVSLKGALNYTTENLRLSKNSNHSGSIVNNASRVFNDSAINSINEHRRAISLNTSANKVVVDRQRQVSEVRAGYKSNAVFQHTIADVIKVLEHKLARFKNA